MGRLLGVSPLGDYESPLQLLIYLTSIKPIARVLIRLPKWAPSLDSGRGIQVLLPATNPHQPPLSPTVNVNACDCGSFNVISQNVNIKVRMSDVRTL